MEFTPRIQQILRIMLNSRGPVNKQDIADDIGVSKRTVQREFEYLELCIKKYGLKLENHKGKGVEIKGSPENIEKLREDLGDQQYPDAATRRISHWVTRWTHWDRDFRAFLRNRISEKKRGKNSTSTTRSA